MEAASVAWEPLGWKAVGFSEIEPFPCAVLAHRFPNTPNYGSLTEYQSWPLSIGDVDLLCGGTPCQSYSVAGKRGGLNDPRGQLMLSFLDLAAKLQPKWILWENVPGVLSSGQPRGADFATFLQGLVERGYGWAYRVLDAQYVGRCRMHSQGSGWDAVPQRRRRVFVVACRGTGGWESAASVLLKPESLCWHPAPRRKKGQTTAADAGASVEAGGGCWWDGGQVSQTLDAVLQKGQTMPEKNRFPAVLQPKSHWEGGEVHPTLNQSAKGCGSPGYSNQKIFSQQGGGLVPVPFRKSKRACSTTDNETWVEADASNTLNNFDLGDTRTTHAVVEPVAIQGTIIGRGENAGPQGTGATDGGPMFTLTKTDIHGVCHHMPGSVAPTVTSSGPPYSRTGNERVEAEALAITFQPGNLRREAGADPSTTTTTTTLKASAGDQMPHIATPMAVRRLTPTECERLQGFPDNWSQIPWKGKPADQCPDGPRYKACGNSMAVPVMRWIGEQIARVELSLNNPTK